MPLQTDTSELVHDSISDKPGSDSNLEKLNMKALSESLDAEGKEFIIGSKPCNTVFTTGQSKFEDMITTSAMGRTINSAQDAAAGLRLKSSHFYLDSSTNNEDLILVDNSFSHDPRVQVAASECGTEITISSTLSSPERSEAEGGEIVLELGSLEKQKYDAINGSVVSFNPENAGVKSPSFHQEVQQPERLEEHDQNPASSIPSSDVVQAEQPLAELTSSHLRSQAENSVDQQIDRSSLEGTPQIHTMATELYGTPSSQKSVDVKKKKKESRKSDGKLISQIGNKSPSNSTKDSGGRSTAEQLQKDSKNAKRRSSLGVAKPEHVDQEPRLSTSNPFQVICKPQSRQGPRPMQVCLQNQAQISTTKTPILRKDIPCLLQVGSRVHHLACRDHHHKHIRAQKAMAFIRHTILQRGDGKDDRNVQGAVDLN